MMNHSYGRTEKSVTLTYKKEQYEIVLSQNSKCESLMNTIKDVFKLTLPFSLKYRIYDNSFVMIKDQEGLLDFLKRKFFSYTLYVIPEGKDAKKHHMVDNIWYCGDSRDENALNNEKPSLESNPKPQKKNKSTKKSTPQINSNSHDSVNPCNNRIPEGNQPKPKSRPQEAFVSPDMNRNDQNSDSSSPLNQVTRAKKVQEITMKYQKALKLCPPIFLSSQLLVDQILHGVNIDLEILNKTLQRRALSNELFAENSVPQINLIESVSNPKPVHPPIQPDIDVLTSEIEAFGIPMDD